MTTRPRTSLHRRTTTAAVALVLALSLAACGGGTDTGATGDTGDTGDTEDTGASAAPSSSTAATTATDEPTTESTSDETEAGAGVPTEDELAAALLTAADVPAGFTLSPPGTPDSDNVFAGTCLADIGKFSEALGFEPDSEAEVEFASETAQGQSSVASKLEAYADPTEVAPAFAAFSDELQTCTKVSTTDADGVRYELRIGYDDSVDLPGAEDQLRIQMTGTISAGAQKFDVTFRVEVALTGSIITVVSTYAGGDADTAVLDSIDDLATLQAQRVGDLA